MSKGRQYPKYVRQQYDKMPSEQVGAFTMHTAGDFLAVKCDPPRHNDCWGAWRYNAKVLTLEYRPADDHWDYEIDLEDCATSAQMLDWIFQISDKHEDCISRQDIGDLVQAFRDLLNPQATLCSWGAERGPINVAALLKRKAGVA